MAWAKVGTGTPVSGHNIPTLNPAWPSHSAGDIGLLFAFAQGDLTIATPSGWTLLNHYNPGAHESFIFAKVAASGSEPAPSVVSSGVATNNNVNCWIDVFSGGFTPLADIISQTPVNTSSSGDDSAEYGAYTPAHNDTLVLIYAVRHENWGSEPSPPTGFTTGNSHNDPTGGSDNSAYYAYQIQTTAAPISAGSILFNGPAAGHRTTVIALRSASAAAPPTFDSNPQVTSQTATSYMVDYEADANASTIYVGAYPIGATAPTSAQLKAGTGAHGTASEATTGAADTINLVPSDTPKHPKYDLYAVLEGTGGFSSVVALPNKFLDPPAGKQFTILLSVHTTSPWNGTEVAAGDIVSIDTVTDPDGFAVTCEIDGTVIYDAGGSEDRQLIDAQVFDVSSATYFAADIIVFNNLPPEPPDEEVIFEDPVVFVRNEAITAVDLETQVIDPEGDAITVTAEGAMPAGMADPDVTEDFSGTPTTYSETVTPIRWTDQYGDFYQENVTIQIGDRVPDVEGLSEAATIAAIEAVASFTAVAGGTESSGTIAAGLTTRTVPAIGQPVPEAQAVTYFLSVGASVAAAVKANYYRMMGG